MIAFLLSPWVHLSVVFLTVLSLYYGLLCSVSLHQCYIILPVFGGGKTSIFVPNWEVVTLGVYCGESFHTYYSPDCVVPSLLFASRPNMLSQAYKCACMMLKLFSSCWIPMILESTLDNHVDIRKQSTLLKLRNLSQSIRRGPWWFWSLLRGLDSLELVSPSSRTSREQQQLDRELRGCLLAARWFWWRRGLCPAVHQCFISSSYLQGHVHHHLYWRWYRWPA